MTEEERNRIVYKMDDGTTFIEADVKNGYTVAEMIQADIARQLTIANELKRIENEHLENIAQSIEGIVGTMGDYLISTGVYNPPQKTDAIGKDEANAADNNGNPIKTNIRG